MNYEESREYVKSLSKYGSVLGLENIEELLNRLGNPQNDLKVVHVAGTNGKGSVLTYVESVLVESGYKVGKYSSPAVFEYLEIYRISGKNILESQYSKYMTLVAKAAEDMYRDGFNHPTAFEVETALAFFIFAKEGCDVVLLETGMGGSTDATNVVQKVLCSVIVNISFDHMQFLGDTLDKIASVKAGIIKEKCPVVLAKQSEVVTEVIRDKTDEKLAELIITSMPEAAECLEEGITFGYESSQSIDGNKVRFNNINISMIGTYQLNNAATALEVLVCLEKQGYKVLDNVEAGMKSAVVGGRFEKISDKPLIIIDGAHNPDGAMQLRKSVEMYFTNRRIAFIMGVLADKDYEKVAGTMAPLANNIFTITPDNARALDAASLAATVSRYNDSVVACDSISDALDNAYKLIENDEADMILVFGSLSYLGEVKRIVKAGCQ